MKTITKYVADDGTEFNSLGLCWQHEDLCKEIAGIMSALAPCDVSGSDWVQQDRDTVLIVQRALIGIYKRIRPDSADEPAVTLAYAANQPAGNWLIGRFICDCSCGPLRGAWGRLSRMDHLFREYEQPYYAIQSDRRQHPL